MRCKQCKCTFRKTHESRICGHCRRGIINPKIFKNYSFGIGYYSMTEDIKTPIESAGVELEEALTQSDEQWKEEYIKRQLQASCRRKTVTVDGSMYRVMKAISFLQGKPLGETYSTAVFEWASKKYPELVKDVQVQFQEDLEKSIQQSAE